MTFLFYGILFVSGLIVGSFLNVATLRYDPDRGFSNMRLFGGRSHCVHCRAQLRWHELIPVLSFLILRGRCRHCAKRISVQYPLVELLTAFLFVAVPMRIGTLLHDGSFGMVPPSGAWEILSILWVLVFVLFLVLAVIDLHHMIIPDFVAASLAFLGVAIAGFVNSIEGFGIIHGSFLGHYAMLFGIREQVVSNHVFAAALGMLFFGSIIVLSKGRAMGWGDFKLAGALGLLFGWPDIALVLALSFIVGAAVSLFLMARRRAGMRDAVPFGPFLVIGAALVFFFGFRIVSLYFGSFGFI